ncbi:Abi family protein [Bacillus kwashiorkori]|uniref:Abi family protein n=1 Tax=Bacillus kwashiorkori TaxID=1522318 RepID=UPI000784CD90|nr:Abi family protein [Bacillus kwashiorkori]
MSKNLGKQTDALMRHLRHNKNIKINGSKQKKELLSMGYYHGYKGYRFIKSSAHQIAYTDFNQLLAVYTFDMNLKGLFYPYIMTIETALKNYTIDTLQRFRLFLIYMLGGRMAMRSFFPSKRSNLTWIRQQKL